jgi:eukaryotic-like serine/threonine-protein kinase
MRKLPAAIATLVEEPEQSRRLGQFVLVRQLGRGGFAPVWSAREEYAGRVLRTVAIKLFALESDDDEPESSVEQVLEEARTLCRVEHPNIVRFHSVAIDAKRRVAGFAMEHLEGTALDRVLGEGSLRLPEVVEVGIAVASALAAVHRAGIVHRDVKPGNIIETAAGYKLIDFGIAAGTRLVARSVRTVAPEVADRLLAEADTGFISATLLTDGAASPKTLSVELAAGTMGYIDPECIQQGRPASSASDLYSLGATLFELASGKLPAGWDGKLIRGDIIDGRARPPGLRDMDSSVDADFSELVDKLLSPTSVGRPTSAEWVVSKLERLRHVLAGRDRPLPPEQVGPFRGLARFEASDRGVYFGRSLEVAQALHVLRIRGFVALVGPSGSGKSSLASAGLLPAIEDGLLQGWPAHWDTLSMTPGVSPAETLRTLLKRLMPLEAGASQQEVLAALGRRAEVSGRGVALLIDQLEELATLSKPASRDWIAELIAQAAEQAVPGLRMLVTARRDLLDPLLELSALGRVLLKNSLLVEAMGSATWLEVLDQALAAYGYRCEDDALRDELVAEIQATATAMPLVAFALGRLWQMRDTKAKVVTREALQQLGGIAGALAQHAQGTYESLTQVEPATVRRAMVALTTARGTRATRSQEELNALAGDGSARVMKAFERAHLVVRTPNGLTLAHEVLISKWQLLRSWVAEEQGARSLVEELESDAARHALDPAGVPLWSRRRLLAMADVSSRGDVTISRGAREYLEAGRRAERRRRVLFGGVAAAVLALLAGGVIIYLDGINDASRRTEDALKLERKSRQLADRQTQAVQAKQTQIDELLRNVTDSPTKEAVLELQRQIRAAGAPATPGAARPPSRASTTLRDTPAAAASVGTPSPTASTAQRLKVQSDW